MSITKYQANLMLQRDFGSGNPEKHYIALSTTPIQQDGNGCTEPSNTTGYKRVGVKNDETTWYKSTDMKTHNLIDFEFEEATATWGTITHLAIFDALDGGNMIFYEALPKSRLVQEDTSLIIETGALKIEME